MNEYVKVSNQSLFDKHIYEKGLGVVEEVAMSLKVMSEAEYITSDDIIGFIRYDKFLREKLYKYLSVTEEFLRNELYKNLEYNGSRTIMYTKDYKSSDFKVNEDNSYGYNFFKKAKMLFSVIIDLYTHFEGQLLMSFKFSLEDIKNIGNLRNLVMHHSLLVINQNSTEITKDSIGDRVMLVLKYLMSLIYVIPNEYRKGLITDINKANLDKGVYGSKSKYIYIEFIEGGY
ncbi:Abi family protein [Mycoplasmatota bacterium]|nr:Abi family protein [Mycoplasmatota bacterium]